MRLSQIDFENKVRKIYGDCYSVLGTYLGRNHNVKIMCTKCLSTREATGRYILNGSFSCKKCSHQRKEDEFMGKFERLSNGEFEIVGEFTSTLKEITLRHSKCGTEFSKIPANFFNYGKIVCPHCLIPNGKKTTEVFKKEVYDLHKDEYQVLGDYESAHQKIKMKHMKCGHEWMVLPFSITSKKSKCPKCSSNYRGWDKSRNSDLL